MTQLPQRFSPTNLTESATIAANNEAKKLNTELSKKGQRVVSLTLGETPFPPDLHVLEEYKKRLTENIEIFSLEQEKRSSGQSLTKEEQAAFDKAVSFYKYSPVAGKPETRDAIASYTKGYGLRNADASNTIVTNGAKSAISHLIESVIGQHKGLQPYNQYTIKKDEAMIFSPAWVSYFDLVDMAGGKVNEIPPEIPLTAANLKKQLENFPDTKLLIINPVNNPTGKVTSNDEMEKIFAVINEEREKRKERFAHGDKNTPDLIVMSDDIYKDLRFDGSKHQYGEQANKLFNEGGLVIIDGVAKSMNMTGSRIGWAVGSKDLINRMTTIQTNRSSNVASETQLAATLAINSPYKENLLAEQLEIFKQRRDIITEELKKIDGITLDDKYPTQGAFYVYADVKDLIGRKVPDTITSPYGDNAELGDLAGKTLNNTDDVAKFLLKAAYVGSTSGNGFRNDGVDDEHIRFSYAAKNEDLKEAGKRIAGAVAQLGKKEEISAEIPAGSFASVSGAAQIIR